LFVADSLKKIKTKIWRIRRFGGSDVASKLLTVFFHFLSLDSIDYIMIILELISPQQRTIEQKYLLTTQKKITIIKKKKKEEDREYCHRPPARPRSITEATAKANFWSTDLTKNIK